MKRVWLNVDVGEHDDEPDELFGLADVLNVACGGHAGDEASMRRVLVLSRELGTRAGAHPSYPDREGFGRREQALTPEALRATVAEQCDRLAEIAGRLHVSLAFVKPHGALYHAADRDRAAAEAVLAGAVEALGHEITCIGPAGGRLAEAARALGVGFAREGFADRGVDPEGKLLPRGTPGALITDPPLAAARARDLAGSGAYDTLCLHGDTPGAIHIARAVRAAIDAAAQLGAPH